MSEELMEADVELKALKDRFQVLVDRFGLGLDGATPFNALQLDHNARGASHGEKLVVQFRLSVWDPSNEWTGGQFNYMETGGGSYRQAYAPWFVNPFFP